MLDRQMQSTTARMQRARMHEPARSARIRACAAQDADSDAMLQQVICAYDAHARPLLGTFGATMWFAARGSLCVRRFW